MSGIILNPKHGAADMPHSAVDMLHTAALIC
jgi:hypothetical protein